MAVVDQLRLDTILNVVGKSELQGLNSEIDKTVSLSGTATTRMQGMASSFLKSQIAMETLKFGMTQATEAFKDGLKEMQETEEATRRIGNVAKQTGIGLNDLAAAANSISADKLIEADVALQGIADLAQKGFKSDELTKMGAALEDISAAAGGNTQANFQKLVDSITTGRVAGDDLARMLPTLKANLEEAGVSMADMADKSKQAQVQQALFKTVMEQWNTVGDASAAKLKTITGQMEAMSTVTKDLKEAWATGLIEGFKGSTEVIGGTASTMAELEGSVKALGTGISTVLVVAFKALKAAVDFALLPLDKLIEWFIAAPGIVNEFQTKLLAAAKSFESFGTGLVTAIQDGIERQWENFKGWFASKLQTIRDMLPHSDAKFGPLSTLTAAGVAFWGTFAEGLSKGEITVLSAIQAGANAMMNVLTKSIMNGIGKLTSGMGGIFGSLFKGFLGGLASALGPIVSSILGSLAKLFQHDWGKDVQKQVTAFLPGLQLSDDLIKRIADDAKKMGNAMAAVFTNLDSIISDVGLTAENVHIFISELRNGFSLLQDGVITTSQLVEELDQNFQQLADASTDALGLISADMREIISLAQQFGIESQAITDFINQQLSGVAGGVNQVAQNMNVRSQGQANLLQAQILTAFNALIANGATVQEAMAALAPAFDVLSNAIDEFGVHANAALAPLLEMQQLAEDFPRAFSILDGVNQQLIGLANSGNLTKDAFKNLEAQAKNAFKRIIADGHVSDAELQSIAPTLALLSQLSEQMGFHLSNNVQSLIDLAESRGFLNSKDDAQDLNTVLTRLTDTLDRFVDTLNRIPSNIDTTITTSYVDSGAPGGKPIGGGGGGGIVKPGDTQLRTSGGATEVPIYTTNVTNVYLDGHLVNRTVQKGIDRKIINLQGKLRPNA